MVSLIFQMLLFTLSMLTVANIEGLSSPCTLDPTVDQLLHWIQRSGTSTSLFAVCSGLHPIHRSRGLFVDQDIPANTVLLSIPLRLTLNRLTAKEPPLTLHYPKRVALTSEDKSSTTVSTSSIETMAALFLLHAKHLSETPQGGKWDQYIKVLPTRSQLWQLAKTHVITPPLYWTRSQHARSKSSGIGQLVRELNLKSKATWRELFHPKHGRLVKNERGRAVVSKAFGKVSVLDFQWALSMVLSRSFKIPIPWDKKKHLRHVLIPGADLINYARNATTRLRIHGRSLKDARLEIVSSVRMARGHELTSTYGQLNSPCVHTLIHYGFCDDSEHGDNAGNHRGRAAVMEIEDSVVLVERGRKIKSAEERIILNKALQKIQGAFSVTDGTNAVCDEEGIPRNTNHCEIVKTLRQEAFILQSVIESNQHFAKHEGEL